MGSPAAEILRIDTERLRGESALVHERKMYPLIERLRQLEIEAHAAGLPGLKLTPVIRSAMRLSGCIAGVLLRLTII